MKTLFSALVITAITVVLCFSNQNSKPVKFQVVQITPEIKLPPLRIVNPRFAFYNPAVINKTDNTRQNMHV